MRTAAPGAAPRRARVIGASFFVLVLAGCVAQPAGRPAGTAPTVLTGTPFFPQQIHECGPAALATILVYSGVDTTPEQLAQRVYIPDRQGSLQVEMLAATRRLGRIPWTVAPTLDAIAAEIAAGHPVLVLQNLLVRSVPRWHYAVVIGVDSTHVTLRSGDRPMRRMRIETFLRTWRYADHWSFVALRPGEWPAQPNPRQWLMTYAAFEQIGTPTIARSGYETGVQRWPDDAKLWFALGNARYGGGDVAGAGDAYERSTRLDASLPEPWNNLAQTWIDRRCRRRAAAALSHAQELNNDSVRAAIEDTAAALGRLPAGEGPGC